MTDRPAPEEWPSLPPAAAPAEGEAPTPGHPGIRVRPLTSGRLAVFDGCGHCLGIVEAHWPLDTFIAQSLANRDIRRARQTAVVEAHARVARRPRQAASPRLSAAEAALLEELDL